MSIKKFAHVHKLKSKATSPTRNLNTPYQNTTGHPLIVQCNLECYRASAVDAYAYAIFRVGPVPIEPVGIAGLGTISNSAERMFAQGIIIVPPNYYYVVNTFTSAGSTVILETWYEVELWVE